MAHRYLILFVELVTSVLVLWDTHGYREIMSIGDTIIVLTVCVPSLFGFTF